MSRITNSGSSLKPSTLTPDTKIAWTDPFDPSSRLRGVVTKAHPAAEYCGYDTLGHAIARIRPDHHAWLYDEDAEVLSIEVLT